MNDDFDELDRALFALPLEMPPAGLRRSILDATIFAPRSVAPLVRPWEPWLMGIALAVGAWLMYALYVDKNAAASFASALTLVAHSIGEPMTLAWLAVGGAVSAWLLFFNSLPPRRLGSGRV